MTRDMELCRAILLEIERCHNGDDVLFANIKIDGYELNRVSYHIRILADAGLVAVCKTRTTSGFIGELELVRGLSWRGHEFLDATRSTQNWVKVKSLAAKAGGWTFEILKDVAVSIIKGELQKSGVPLSS